MNANPDLYAPDPPDPGDAGRVPPHVPPEREHKVLRLLIAGFGLIIALLVMDGFVGFHSILSIRANVSALTEDQFLNVVLIDEVQRTQSGLSSVLYTLSNGVPPAEKTQLERRVDQLETRLRELFARIPPNDPDIAIWREVELASAEVTASADRILAAPTGVRPDIQPLLASREHLLSATGNLIRSSHRRAESTRQYIEQTTSTWLLKDAALLGACVILALVCAWLVLRTATRLYFRMTEQSEELHRVSWQLLEKQETLARRLSHELHDELGQSLTALKANLARHVASGCTDPHWVEDCTELVRGSMRSAHEISQLLRPTILDDFGLASAIGWLCERCEERSGIVVTYHSDIQGRLDEQTETHVFRIAQEALTNVIRHARATEAVVTLRQEPDSIRLLISDNGSGFEAKPPGSRQGFGVTGMRARARTLSGELDIRTSPGAGTVIDAVFPYRGVPNEEKNPHPVG
ncbi:MAG: MCP four helix bundle domain-containing protein [Bryobacterales bacterium]|nr:MCP four helix bundle domain-containing protein [Bryobacterales bacterium]